MILFAVIFKAFINYPEQLERPSVDASEFSY